MRIVFMGTPDFAVPSLKILLDNGYEVVGVVTAVDKPGGRSGIIESAVKKFAVANGLRVLQPLKLKDPVFLAELSGLNADLQVVVAFRMLPEVVWQMPPLGTLNLHGSLLPKYRGAAPINHAIMNGETETGVTTFFLQHEIDTGDIILQRKMDIRPNETVGAVHDRMMVMGAAVVLETVTDIQNGTVKARPQPSDAATHAPKIFQETCKIDFNRTAGEVHNFIRGLSPYPGAWTVLKDGKIFKVFKALPEIHADDMIPAGSYVIPHKGVLKVKVKDGYIHLLEVQLEGKKRMAVSELLNGYKFLL